MGVGSGLVCVTETEIAELEERLALKYTEKQVVPVPVWLHLCLPHPYSCPLPLCVSSCLLLRQSHAPARLGSRGKSRRVRGARPYRTLVCIFVSLLVSLPASPSSFLNLSVSLLARSASLHSPSSSPRPPSSFCLSSLLSPLLPLSFCHLCPSRPLPLMRVSLPAQASATPDEKAPACR